MRRSIVTALSVLTIVAVAGTAASATGVMDIRTRTSSVCAEFTDTVGLYEGNSVTMLGVEVGTVTRIESADTSVVVTMDVDDTVTLPADVGAVTR